jgi:Co/Zn/Cd efflux system component
VVINLGVITAGALVAWTGSNYPDLIISTIAGALYLTVQTHFGVEGLNNAHYWQKLSPYALLSIGPAGSV